MKNKIAILLLCVSLSLASQTKVKFSQMENPATSSVNLNAGANVGSFFNYNGNAVNFGTGGTVLYSSTGVPLTRSLTINGITYNLTADRSFTTNFAPTNLKTASYTLTPFEFVPVDLSVGSLTVTLPANPTDRTYACIKIITAASPNVLTIKTGTSTNTINRVGGVTSFTLSAQNQGYQFLYSSLTSVWYITADDLPSTYLDTKYWNVAGNAVASNTTFIGPTDARSFRIKTNNIERVVIDSSTTANLKVNANLLIDQSGGVNTVNPKKWSIQPFPGDNSYLCMYSNQNIPGNNNYTFIWDSTLTKLNGPKTLILSQGGGNQGAGLSIVQSQVNGNDGASLGGGVYGFASCVATSTSLVNNSIPMVKYASHSYSLSGGTVPNFHIEQRQAPNIKSTSATVLTNYQPYNFPEVTFDAGVTKTNDYGLRNDCNFTCVKNAYIGGLIAPTQARLTLAAGNATLPAMHFNNQSAMTSTVTGDVYFRNGLGLVVFGGLTTDLSARIGSTVAPTSTLDVTGTMSVSSTSTLNGLRVVGALSVTTTGSIGTTFTVGGASTTNGIANVGSITTSTTFSAGTTSTLAGNTRIGGTTAPNNALSVTGALDVSTTFSAGTTSTLAGNTRIGGTTAPNGALSVTGAIDASTTFSCGSTATIGAGLRCVGAMSVTTTMSVGSTCTFAASVRIGSATAPTALLHLAAGTTEASTAPLKFTSGTNMTTAEAGAMEYDGTNLFFTPTGTTRNKIVTALTGSATLDFPNTLAQTDSDLTITVTGAADGDPVDVGMPNGSTLAGSTYTGWVSSANTVTVRFSVYGLTAKDPASGTFKVTVFKN